MVRQANSVPGNLKTGFSGAYDSGCGAATIIAES